MKQAAATLVLLSGLFLWGQEPNPWALGTRIELSKVEGRIDHFTADVKGHRPFMRRSKTKLQMKRGALTKLNRQGNESAEFWHSTGPF